MVLVFYPFQLLFKNISFIYKSKYIRRIFQRNFLILFKTNLFRIYSHLNNKAINKLNRFRQLTLKI